MLLAESAVICAAALGAALALTALTLAALAPVIETQLGRPAPRGTSSIAVDSTVLVATGAISVIVALMLSLAPLLMARDRQLTDALRQDGRGTGAGPSMRRMRSALIAFELAGSLVLLAGCGLMIRSTVEMLHTDLGFRAAGLVRTRIVMRARQYPDRAAYRRIYGQLADRVSAVTGSPVVFTNWPPFTITPRLLIEKEAGGDAVPARTLGVSAGYFSMHGVRIRQGRDFTAAEASAAESVAVISETLSRSLWPDGDAIGKRARGVEQTQGGSTPGPWRTIVGIAADVRQTYEDNDRNDFYTPMMPENRFGSFYLQTRQPVSLLLESVKTAVAGIDRDATVNEPRPVPAEDQRLSGTGFMTSLLTGFAGVALFLAMMGIYGATAYTVQQRRKEIAVRVALGASSRTVSWMFLREAALVLGTGTAGGLLCAVPVSRALRDQVYGVESFDPLTYAVACTLLIGTALAAVWWPSRRAAMGNPTAALNTN
jgi:predicted permease